MPIRLKTDREVAKLKTPGKHSLGGNMYLQVSPSGSRSFVGRVTDNTGRRRDLGLGNYPLVSLGEAREKVRLARQAVTKGEDPVEALNPKPTPSFETLARQVHAERERNFKNAKHCAQWITTLETYAFPFIGKKPVDKVTSADVLALLRPIWNIKQETAHRVLQRVATVINCAVPEGYREHELPVKGISKGLPPQKRDVRDHPSVPYVDAPKVYRHIASLETMSGNALRLLLLTAVRSGEAR